MYISSLSRMVPFCSGCPVNLRHRRRSSAGCLHPGNIFSVGQQHRKCTPDERVLLKPVQETMQTFTFYFLIDISIKLRDRSYLNVAPPLSFERFNDA